MTSGAGVPFIAEVDWEAWRRPLVPWVGGGCVAVLVVIVAMIASWLPAAAGLLALAAALAMPAAKLSEYVARRRRRESPLTVDVIGVCLPTAQGPAFLPWDTLRQVVVDGPTLRFRLRAGVTPNTPGVTGLHRRDAWPVASGPGLPVDTRLFTRDRDDILDAVHQFSGGRVWSPAG
ncbi:hypothetical protein [Alloactinosynnema sp. L-07]|uniref:hypothetical protein n=1 Tax=Alloactinosynnema sp. L-07 TaxID=1653480 RepID=UPI00065EF5EA|nr:hypothetical protein [Alloactinosynnema sp. L-07]CRK57111.1 hypothetical protein [Alloactinosynnema sp. L-07]